MQHVYSDSFLWRIYIYVVDLKLNWKTVNYETPYLILILLNLVPFIPCAQVVLFV